MTNQVPARDLIVLTDSASSIAFDDTNMQTGYEDIQTLLNHVIERIKIAEAILAARL